MNNLNADVVEDVVEKEVVEGREESLEQIVEALEGSEGEKDEKVSWEDLKKEIMKVRASTHLPIAKQINKRERVDLYRKQSLHQIEVGIVKKVCRKNRIEVLSKGWPDLVLFKENKVLFIEIKTGRIGKLTSEQIKIKDVLEKLGLEYRVVNSNREKVEESIKELTKEW